MTRIVKLEDVPKDYRGSDLFQELKEQAEENNENTITIVEGMPFRTRMYDPSEYGFVHDDADDLSTRTIDDHELFMEYLENFRFWGFWNFDIVFLVHYVYFEQNKQEIIDKFPELKILKIFEDFDDSCIGKTKMKCIAAKEFKLIKDVDLLLSVCNGGNTMETLPFTVMIMNGDEEVFKHDDQYLIKMFELKQWSQLLNTAIHFNLPRYMSNISIHACHDIMNYHVVFSEGAKNIQTIQGKQQMYEFVDESRFAKDPIEFIKELKNRGVAFNLEALAWTAVGGHPRCMTYMIENMPDVDKSFKLCNIAAINDNVECVIIAKDMGFDPYIDLDSVLGNNNLACLEYCFINKLFDFPNEWDYCVHLPSEEVLILVHKYNIEIHRYFIVNIVSGAKSLEEYFEFFEQIGFTFTTDDYDFMFSIKNIIDLHKFSKIPFSFENSYHFSRVFRWENEDLADLKYIDEHGGINWDEYKSFVESTPHFGNLSKTLIKYAVEKGIKFDESKVGSYVLAILHDINGVRECKRQKK